jgi:hypothetical protein
MTRVAAAGLLVAAVVSARPALGRGPDEKCCESARAANPWRGQSANPWRGQVAQAPRAASDPVFQFYIGLFGDTPTPTPPPAGEVPAQFEFSVGLFDGLAVPVAPCPPPVGPSVEVQIPNLTWTYRGPVTSAPVPRSAPNGICAGVCESRTGQFMFSGAINYECPQCVPTVAPPAPLTVDDVVRMSGRHPVTLAPLPGCCSQPAAGVRVAAAESVAVVRPAGNRLHGTWYRELPGAVVAFTFAGDELRATGHVNIDGVSGCVTLTAEYAVSKDGTVHGVITGADATGCGGDLGGLELVSVAVIAQMFVDQPFAFRMKPTADGLMLSNVRFPAAEPLMDQGPGPKMSGLLCGLYRPAKGGTIPAAKALKMSAVAGPGEPCCDGLLDVLGGLFGQQTVGAGLTLPSPAYLQHAPQYFPPAVALPPPCEQPVPPPCAAMPYPVALPPGAPVFPPQWYSPPAPPLPAGAVVPCLPCPPGGYPPAPPMVFPPCPPGGYPVASAMNAPPPMPRMEAAPARPGYVGEWNRTVGPCTIGLSATASQLTAKGMMPVDGELMRVVVTADCREIREGLVAGVITCAEVEPVGTTAHLDTDPGRLRGLVDQPFSCRFQVRGDELIVIDLKVGGEHQVDAGDLGIIGGRYAKGEPKWPTDAKGKKGAVTPAGATGDVIRVGIDFNGPPPSRVISTGQPVAPGTILPMLPPQPLPEPPVPDRPKGKKKKGQANAYSPDPNVRVEQLLYQSEDLRQIGEQWKRLWFNDRPSHLTPERVHGGTN